MNQIWTTVLGSGFGAAVIWGIVVITKMLLNRPMAQATTAEALSGTALKLLEEARDDAKAARDEAKSARQDADSARRDASEARREATEARREAMDSVAEMRRWKSAILSPYATLEKLRDMVGDPGANGTVTAISRH